MRGRTRQREGAPPGRDRDQEEASHCTPVWGSGAVKPGEQETRFISRSVIRAFKTRPHKVPIVGPWRVGQIESQQPEKGPGEGVGGTGPPL